MKHIIRFSLIVAALTLAAACSEDYMETAPESSTSPATIFSSTTNVPLAINGLSKMMTCQYLSTQGLNGEGSIKTWYGNFGNDLQRSNQTGWAALWNHTMNEAEGSEAERQYYKAQALVFRAHAFTMLMQLYAYRWQDSNNGAGKGIALRLSSKTDDEGTYDLPLSTQAECYAQIYADCDEAISLFKSCGIDRGSDEFYKPNINVAYAVKTRAALVREDWATVVACAPEARKGHPLMSKD